MSINNFASRRFGSIHWSNDLNARIIQYLDPESAQTFAWVVGNNGVLLYQIGSRNFLGNLQCQTKREEYANSIAFWEQYQCSSLSSSEFKIQPDVNDEHEHVKNISKIYRCIYDKPDLSLLPVPDKFDTDTSKKFYHLLNKDLDIALSNLLTSGQFIGDVNQTLQKYWKHLIRHTITERANRALIILINCPEVNFSDPKKTVKEFVKCGADLAFQHFLERYRSDIVTSKKKSFSLFLFALEEKRWGIAQYLLETTPTIADARNPMSSTALHFAALSGHEGIVELLLIIKPEIIDIQNRNGRTALHSAVSSGHLGVTRLLLRSRPKLIDIRDERGETALCSAASGGREEIFRLLLKIKPEMINDQCNSLQTVLHRACIFKHANIARLILEKAPNLIYVQDFRGNTACHWAAAPGSVEIVQLLLKIDPAIVNIRNKQDQTALQNAKLFRYQEVITLIESVQAQGIQVPAKRCLDNSDESPAKRPKLELENQ